MQQSHESLETFYSRIREAGALCKYKDLEEDLVKDLFISNMTNTSIQMDLLSEVRTPQQVLNFAINRERGQANQQEILRAHTNNTSWSQVSCAKPKTSLAKYVKRSAISHRCAKHQYLKEEIPNLDKTTEKTYNNKAPHKQEDFDM